MPADIEKAFKYPFGNLKAVVESIGFGLTRILFVTTLFDIFANDIAYQYIFTVFKMEAL